MDMIKTKKRFLLNIVAFYAMLGYGYYFYYYIFQNYANKLGFGLDMNWLKMGEGFVVVMLLALFYVYNDLNESVYLMFTFIFYVLIMVPSASYYFLSNQTRAFFYMQVCALLILNGIFLLNKTVFQGRKREYPLGIITRARSSHQGFAMKLFLVIVGVIMVADILIYIKYGNSILYLFKLDKVYDIRLKAREAVPGKLRYIISWSAMVIVPSSIAWCMMKKKYWFVIVPVMLQVLIFTIGGTKSHIFTLAMVVFLYIMFSFKKMYLFIPCLNFMLAITLLTKKAYIMAVVVHRAFFYPMSISYNYFEFFSQFPQLNLSQSILRHFFQNPYKLDAPFIISRYIYKAPNMSANNNYISNAYANFGFLGIILFTIVVALVLVTIERISQGKVGKQYVIMFTFCSFFALVNSALLTTLMTHGLLFSLFMAYLFFRDADREEEL